MKKEDYEKLEKEVGKDALHEFATFMTNVLADMGDTRAIILKDLEQIKHNQNIIVSNLLNMNNKQLRKTDNFLKQLNKLLSDYVKENKLKEKNFNF